MDDTDFAERRANLVTAIEQYVRGSNRAHWIATAKAAARYPFPEPPFFAGAAELDALEQSPCPTAVEIERRDELRRQREIGVIAEVGETWRWFLIERGLARGGKQ